MFSVMGTPHITNFQRPLAIIAFITAGVTAIIFDKIGEKWPKFGEFSFACSILAAMLVVGLVNAFIN
jgi:hypothetical protein